MANEEWLCDCMCVPDHILGSSTHSYLHIDLYVKLVLGASEVKIQHGSLLHGTLVCCMVQWQNVGL